jgi:site-specific DNA-cytosine methylase
MFRVLRRGEIMKVLVACEYSGIVREAFSQRGHDAVSVDLLPTEIPGKHIQGDVMEVIKQEQFDLMIAHPPCTDLAVSGAKWFKEKRADGRQQRALEFVQQLLDAPIPMIALENPVSVISTYIRKANQYVQPWEHGHGETKKTGLWLKGLPLLRPTNIVEGREQKVWLMGPSPDRWKNRSRTYQGIADAMAEQWGNADGYSQGRLL